MSPFGPPNMINSMPGPGHMMFDDHPMGPMWKGKNNAGITLYDMNFHNLTHSM